MSFSKNKEGLVPRISKLCGGYIALTSAIFIGAMVLVIIFVISTGSFLSRVNISTTSYKEKSSLLARACVEEALLKLSQNSSYSGNETISIASDTCRIISIVASGTAEKVISTQAQFNSSFTNLKVTVNSSTLSVVRREELPNF